MPDAQPRRWRTPVAALVLVALGSCFAVWYLLPTPSIAQARRHVDSGDGKAARLELQKILAARPQNAEALMMLGDLLRTDGNRPEAASCYLRVQPEASEFRQAGVNLAETLLEMSDLAGSELQMARHLESFPGERLIWDELRWMCFNQFRTRDVDELSHWWLKGHPDDSQALIHLLLGVFRPQVPQEGADYLRQIDEQVPGQVSVMRALAWAAWQSGRIDESKRLMNDAWQLSADDPRTRLLSAEILIEEQDYEAAARTLGESPISIDGEVFGGQVDRWHWLRSRILQQQDEMAEALSQLDRAIELRSNNLEYIHARALLLRQQGRDAEANEAFERARAIELCKKRFAEIAFSGAWQRPSPELCVEIADLYRQSGDPLVATFWRTWGDSMRFGRQTNPLP